MRAYPAFVSILLGLIVPAVAAAAVIQGTTRPDKLKGTAKADRIDAVFGAIDRVTCGRGIDAVTADPADKIAGDCEFISRRISVDTLTTAGAQHQTEVEPSVAGWGSTAVATFQVGRFRDGGAAGIGWATSTDSGRTWRSGILPALTTATKPSGDAPRASDPVAAYDAAHATWLITTLVLSDAFTALGISRSADGLTWSAPISATRLVSERLAYDKEWLSCDNTPTSRFYGSCYLVYTDIATPRIAAQVSRDGGVTWSAPVTATSAFAADAEGALPLVQPNGALTIVFEVSAGIYGVHSTDGGATFTPAAGISPVDEASRPLLRAPPLPTATVDASGRLFVAWADCAFRPGCDGNTIVLTSSTDGTTWSPLKRVPGAGFDSFVPGIAADPTTPGRMSIVTYVRNSARLRPGDVPPSASRSRAPATEARPGRRRSGSTASRRATRGSRTPAGSSSATTSARRTWAAASFRCSRSHREPLASGRLREFMMSASIP